MQAVLDRIKDALGGLYDKPELDAISKSLCLELLGLDQTDYWLVRRLPFDASRDSLLDNALERLAGGEPLQYVIGTAPFMGLDFKVNRSVLIPRPETAQLVEWVESSVTARRKGRMLDIGTGSGCIAVSLAVRLAEWEINAWDISMEALEIASRNALANGADVRFEQHDILSMTGHGYSFDVIVSNPPYVADSEKAGMDSNVLDYEPGIALFVPDSDPLKFYRAIAMFGREALNPGGLVLFEINPLFADSLKSLLLELSYVDICVKQDIFGKRRMMSARIDKLAEDWNGCS